MSTDPKWLDAELRTVRTQRAAEDWLRERPWLIPEVIPWVLAAIAADPGLAARNLITQRIADSFLTEEGRASGHSANAMLVSLVDHIQRSQIGGGAAALRPIVERSALASPPSSRRSLQKRLKATRGARD